MVTKDDIGWGSYGPTSGPYFKGTISYKLPDKPGFLEKCLAILSATEGKMDACNLYDSCIVSTSMIQLCERFNLTSILLGKVAEKCGLDAVTVPLADAMRISNCKFDCDSSGRWRFHFLDSRGVVDTIAKKKELFLGCSGIAGSWTDESREHAKTWAAGLANVWQSNEAQQVQIDYIKNTMMGYVLKESKKILFADTVEIRSIDMVGAMRAIFISFAANNPKRANLMMIEHSSLTKFEKWSNEWCIEAIKKLTFGPDIAIYPSRYNHIRPVVEKLFGVELPKTSNDLRNWNASIPQTIKEDIPVNIEYDLLAVEEDIYPIKKNNDDVPLPKEIENIIPWSPPQPSFIGFLKWLFTIIMSYLGRKK